MSWKKSYGLIAATFTPMKPDHTLNLNLIPAYIDHLVATGVKQVYVNGTTGECMSLTVDERKQISEQWLKLGRGKLERIIIQCGTGNLAETKELAIHAAKLGADCIAVVAPTYFKPVTLDDLIDYCAEVAVATPKVPFMYYHFPDKTGVNFKMYEFLHEAGKRIPNLIGCKFTSMDLFDATQSYLIDNEKYDVIVGADTIFLGALSMGLKSSIGISFNFLGKPFTRLIEYFEKGDIEKARLEQHKIQEFFRKALKVGNINEMIAVFKSLMKSANPALDFGPCRLPLRTVTGTGDSDQNLQSILTELKFIDWIR